jgi:hypothetical protein
LSEQKPQMANKKRNIIFLLILVIGIIGILSGVLLYQSMLPTSNVILDFEFPAKPDTLYYEEFTVKTDGVLQIELSCIHQDGNLLWYIMDCDASTYLNLNIAEGEFYDFTYKSNIQGENPISDMVEIEAGTYTFVYVQTVGYIGEQTTIAKIVFKSTS